ncbi:MAG: hypothetical protein V4506_09705 [Bacteroidota bacterium]
MKTLYITIVITFVLLTLSTCKKYPDGGFVNQTRMHLFGGHKVGDSKTWKLKLYEVNGIDSTYLIQGAGSIPDFYDKFVTFTYTGKEGSAKYQANTFLYDYSGTIGTTYKEIALAISHDPLNKQDSLQCKNINGTNYCSRNLLFPEINDYAKIWNIKKLTKKECALESTFHLKNSYKIILTQ